MFSVQPATDPNRVSDECLLETSNNSSAAKAEAVADAALAVLNESATSAVDYHDKIYVSVDDMYGADDLSSCPLFKGGLINFGFWKGIDLSKDLTDEERVESEVALYRCIFDAASISIDDDVLEAGSGLGYGCVLAHKEYQVKSMTGLDFSHAQLRRAKQVHEDVLKATDVIRFMQGSAEEMPFENDSFTKIISVEAAQHFPQVTKFLDESHRVLKNGGKLAITTFFANTTDSISPLKELIPTIKDDIDHVVSVELVIKHLEGLGFKNIECVSIGPNVWPGFDKWIAQTNLKDTWNKDWLTAYKNNYVDYYVITAEK